MKNTFFFTKSQKVGSVIEEALIAAQIKFLSINSIKSQKGATMIEYALIAGLVAVAAVATLTTLGTTISDYFTTIKSEIP